MRSLPRRILLPLLFSLACTPEGESPHESTPGDDAAATTAAPSVAATAKPRTRADASKPTIAPGKLEDLRASAAASNAFGLDLYRQLRSARGNLVVSPASLSGALTMTYGGARGTTAEEMKKTLHLGEEPAAALDRGGQLQLDLADSGPVRLTVANRLFGERTWSFEETFLTRTRAAYGAPLAKVDYVNDHEAARQEINAWAEDNTEGLIKNLVPEDGLNDQTRLALVNAIYFLGDWAVPFEKEGTSERPFHLSAEAMKRVPTMSRSMSVATGAFEDAIAVELPYAGDRFSMTFVMPSGADGLDALEGKLRPAFIDGLIGALKPEHVELRLPKFKIEPAASLELSKPLTALGMVDPFDPRKADFSGMASKPLAISRVFHKGFIRVDEKGTEAAAATAVIMKSEGAAIAGREVAFDRPFLFLLRDKRTGLVMFVGRVADPS